MSERGLNLKNCRKLDDERDEMTSKNERNTVERIAGYAAGSTHLRLTHIGRGATSSAWFASTPPANLVVRILPHSVNRPTTYLSEFLILQALQAQGCLVPDPVLNYRSSVAQLADIPEPWSVTTKLDGEPITAARWNNAVAREVGQTLAVLHQLPVDRYGRLDEQASEIYGLQKTEQDGIVARWCWAPLWPFDRSDLKEHPLCDLEPDLCRQINRLQDAILALPETAAGVLVHSDLHAEHIFHRDGRLAGLIDFGAAFIGHPAWDFAVLGFYHGWAITDQILDGYTSRVDLRNSLTAQARLLAISLGLYKMARAVEVGHRPSSAKIQRIIAFIKEENLCAL